MNKVVLIGRISKELELKYTINNKAVCNFTIAVNRTHSNTEQEADFIQCQVWGNTAENLHKYQSKGSLISVEGSLRCESYDAQDGQKRYKNYVLVNSIEFLGTKKQENKDEEKIGAKEISSMMEDEYMQFAEEIKEEDLPF